MSSRIVIVGAGQAGLSLAQRLRALGHDGPITLIGEEPVPPYQRPPLSKAYLKREAGIDRLLLRPQSFFAEAGIELLTGVRVEAIDRSARIVRAGDARIPYDKLALATGAAPRTLPAAIGGALPGVHVLRNLADADGLAPALRPGRRALIVGGGYIGLEAAAVCAALGLSVTLIEAAPRILGRVACAETADWFRDLHRSHGVEIREGVGLARLGGTTQLTGAELADGSRIAADLAIVGIGVSPATNLAAAAGLTIDNGIATDATGRTADPAIWAAGDCASFPGPGGRMRLESVQNAIDMAEAVAADMMGEGAPYAPVPWFWSDQFDAKLQIAGLGAGHDRIVVREATGKGGGRSHWYFRAGTLLAVDAINDPRAYMVGKRLLEAGRTPDAALLADPATNLRALLG
jgi:3-phenylpropionate/trans-cinnamate dioxygenase ferredoxin reductase subunit